jgi:hypothetical protein
MRVIRTALAAAAVAAILAALPDAAGAATVGAGGATVGVSPNTSPDVEAILDCPYASSSSTGHHGNKWDSSTTTWAGTVTVSAPDPAPGGSGLP